VELPFQPPIEPMLAKLTDEIPIGEGWQYEPKWDGFRAIVFRDGPEIYIQSRDLKPLDRYFPELPPALRAAIPERCVLDGEVVIAGPRGLDFDSLLLRIHPAASRVKLLAAQTPASFVAWDLLALDGSDLRATPLGERRRLLEEVLAAAPAPVHLTPATLDPSVAADWFDRFEGAGLDGVVAKRLSGPYMPGKRGWAKIKHARTADCVVAGFRWHKSGDVVGSLLLGLYRGDGTLQHVGVSASFPMARRRSLLDELAPYRDVPAGSHPWGAWADAQAHVGRRMPGNVSRWNATKDLSFVPLRPELVVEVSYDHMEGDRFRHTAQFRRWRPDRDPASCSYEQLEEPVSFDLGQILGRR
jgi:ATP-dependent DNA ligase